MDTQSVRLRTPRAVLAHGACPALGSAITFWLVSFRKVNRLPNSVSLPLAYMTSNANANPAVRRSPKLLFARFLRSEVARSEA